MSNITPLRPVEKLGGELQDELLEVIQRAKYDNMAVSHIVGVLEFLKWNLINRSE